MCFIYYYIMNCPSCKNQLRWVEVRWRYDWISHYHCNHCDKKFSRNALIEMEDDELWRHEKIYKVERMSEYNFIILSAKDDK